MCAGIWRGGNRGEIGDEKPGTVRQNVRMFINLNPDLTFNVYYPI